MKEQENFLIAGGSRIFKTPPFLHIDEGVKVKIKKEYPESESYKKFYVITTKAFGKGELLNVIEIVDEDSRNKAKLYCKEKSKEGIDCRFSKVIRSVDGYVEKFWKENYYMKKISECNRRARRKRKRRKKLNKKRFYPKTNLLIEKTKSKIPNWAFNFVENNKDNINYYFIKHTLVHAIKNSSFIYSKGNISIIERNKKITDLIHSNISFKNYESIIYVNKKLLDNKVLRLMKNSPNNKHLIKRSQAFKYFQLYYVERYKTTDFLLLYFKQKNVLPKNAEGVGMEVFMKMIYKSLFK